MKNSIPLLLLAMSLTLPSCSKNQQEPFIQKTIDEIEKWEKFEKMIRNSKIDKDVAKEKLPNLIERLSNQIISVYNFDDDQKWAFPVKNTNIKAIGGNGKGYLPNIKYGSSNIKGYDFFDGNKHGGHPAHDIFILDKDMNSLDDRTGKPAELVSMVDAVVLSTNNKWDKNKNNIFDNGDIRGGKYIWLYNPKINKFFYYAHLKDIFVGLSDFVKKGQIIATMGRTGSTLMSAEKRWNKKPCPTHLHLMVLEYKSGQLKPFNYYNLLK